jgi:acetoin utilization deacetylase AcuC-like enzyme
MEVVFAEAQLKHDPSAFIVAGERRPNPEVPERAARLLEAALKAGCRPVEPADHGRGPLASVHSAEYLGFLEGIHARWLEIPGAAPEVLPNVHPERRDGPYPIAPVGQAGYHQADTACPIADNTWDSARWSANSALEGAARLMDGASAVYSLCRPPGHHAFADRAGGFCYLNNAALATQALRGAHARVVVLDVDLHHGNGTQGIFYGRGDVLTISIHADPARFYPFFWGHAGERGEDAGAGANLNLPLPLGSGDEDYWPALDLACERLLSFAPGALVVALGLDAAHDDPFGGLAVTTKGFAQIGRRIGRLAFPTLLVQEGGYLSASLGANLGAFLDGFQEGQRAASG